MNPKLKACPACNREIAKAATTCPHCGKNFSTVARHGLIMLIAGLVGWLCFGGALMRALHAGDQIDEAEQSIREGQ